jgi:hypothetical protein
MSIETKYLEIAFDRGGVRNSQKRLKSLITELAVDPLEKHQAALNGQFERVDAILQKRIAAVIAYWCQHKHDPVKPTSKAMMSAITNSTNRDSTLEEFYAEQVSSALYALASKFSLTVPDVHHIPPDELDYALLELEDVPELAEARVVDGSTTSYRDGEDEDDDYGDYDDYDYDYEDESYGGKSYASKSYEDESYANKSYGGKSYAGKSDEGKSYEDKSDEEVIDFTPIAELVEEEKKPAPNKERAEQGKPTIILNNQTQITKAEPQEVSPTVINLTAERAWQLTYSVIGYRSDYIQQQMMPRWQQAPALFEQDRRFLYEIFVETIQNAAGVRIFAGNLTFIDRPITIDQLWNHYYADLAQNVGPILTAAKLHAAVNDPWYKKMLASWKQKLLNLSPVWMLALSIALIFDGLTTYVSLDQTPMEGAMVMVFTVLITALFQIADLLVISYRKHEFEADALIAKYRAKFGQLVKVMETLSPASESYVQLSMEKSQVQADWKAAEDNRKMARRGRFWSARIADINIAVTAYGFAFMFLNSEEPMAALFQQIDQVILRGMWQNFDLWVFLMVGLAITVSFVINTAQRTEILGWTMRRMKKA